MSKDEAIRLLWDAATIGWQDGEDDEPLSLGALDEMRYSSLALSGGSIRGDRLYEIGVASGMIEAAGDE